VSAAMEKLATSLGVAFTVDLRKLLPVAAEVDDLGLAPLSTR
jgi:hypothetical protein